MVMTLTHMGQPETTIRVIVVDPADKLARERSERRIWGCRDAAPKFHEKTITSVI